MGDLKIEGPLYWNTGVMSVPERSLHYHDYYAAILQDRSSSTYWQHNLQQKQLHVSIIPCVNLRDCGIIQYFSTQLLNGNLYQLKFNKCIMNIHDCLIPDRCTNTRWRLASAQTGMLAMACRSLLDFVTWPRNRHVDARRWCWYRCRVWYCQRGYHFQSCSRVYGEWLPCICNITPGNLQPPQNLYTGQNHYN